MCIIGWVLYLINTKKSVRDFFSHLGGEKSYFTVCNVKLNQDICQFVANSCLQASSPSYIFHY